MNMESGHNERMLSAGLKAIASQTLPPASVREAVIAEFRRVNRRVNEPAPIRRPLVQWFALAAAAAAILLAIYVAGFVRMTRAPEKTAVRVAPRVEALAPIAPAVTAAAPKPRKLRRTVKVQPPPADPAPPATTPEIATDFFEIPYAEPLRPDERVDVFRMQMPRANMAVFGLPVTGGRLDSRVTADVLMGEDGVVRAVRFIR